MGIWVKMLTGSTSAAGLVFFAFTAGMMLAPLTGLLADRARRRPLLVAANLATGALVCLLLTLVQRCTPAGLVGRVDAAFTVAITVPQVTSIALGAALIAVAGYRLLLVVMALVIPAAAGYLASPGKRMQGLVPLAGLPLSGRMPSRPG